MSALEDDCDVLILGAGAAGLFCAFTAAQRGHRVRVLERANKVGKKILMSGGGRCNFTNTGTAPEHFISTNPHFCKSALARYRPQDFMALVDAHGITWHEKELGQLFCDDSAKLIVRMLLAECTNAGVRIDTDCEVQGVEHTDAGFELITARGRIRAAKLVVATGGLSIPSLGGSGYGYELARQFGHTIMPLRAGLVPLTLSGKPLEQWQDLAGLSVPVRVSTQDQAFAHAMLITHRGLSGPAMLQISNYWEPGRNLRVDLLPDVPAQELLTQAHRDRPAVELRTVLAEMLPKRFAQRYCEVLTSSKPMRHYKLNELRALADQLHDWPVRPNGTEGYRTAEVTLGGVDTREVSSSSFESRCRPGLYFIGEVLDVTGWLGGYNFQWAWASAHACGQAL